MRSSARPVSRISYLRGQSPVCQTGISADSFSKCLSIFNILENNKKYLNQNPKGEPQLGKRGLYRAIGGLRDGKLQELAMLWVLNLSDGNSSLLDIAERSEIPFDVVDGAADALLEHDLLKEHRSTISAVADNCADSK